MTQITLTIDDPKEATLLRQLLKKFNSVTISRPARERKTGLDEALDDVAAGRVTTYNSVDEMFNQLDN